MVFKLQHLLTKTDQIILAQKRGFHPISNDNYHYIIIIMIINIDAIIIRSISSLIGMILSALNKQVKVQVYQDVLHLKV